MKKLLKCALFYSCFVFADNHIDKKDDALQKEETQHFLTFINKGSQTDVTSKNLSDNYDARALLTLLLLQQKQIQGNEVVSKDKFNEYFDNMSFDMRSNFIHQMFKNNFLIKLDLENKYSEIKGNPKFSMQFDMLQLQLYVKFAQKHLSQLLENEINSTVDNKINKFFESYYISDLGDRKTFDYKIHVFQDKEDFTKGYNLKHHTNDLELSDFLLFKDLDYADKDKRVLHDALLDMIKNKKTQDTLEYKGKYYVFEIDFSSQKNIDVQLLRKLKNAQYTSEVQKEYFTTKMKNLENKVFKVLEDKKGFVLNGVTYDESNLLDLIIIKSALINMHNMKNNNTTPETMGFNLSNKALQKMIKDMSMDDFNKLITNDDIKNALVLNDFFNKNKEEILKSNEISWYMENMNSNQQILLGYYISNNEKEINEQVQNKVDEISSQFYSNDKNRMFYKVRLYFFSNEMLADDFYNRFVDNISKLQMQRKYYEYHDLSDLMISPLMNFGDLAHMKTTYNLAYQVQNAINDDEIASQYKTAQILLPVLDEQIQGYYCVPELYALENINFNAFLKEVSDQNKAYIQKEYTNKIMKEIEAKYIKKPLNQAQKHK